MYGVNTFCAFYSLHFIIALTDAHSDCLRLSANSRVKELEIFQKWEYLESSEYLSSYDRYLMAIRDGYIYFAIWSLKRKFSDTWCRA